MTFPPRYFPCTVKRNKDGPCPVVFLLHQVNIVILSSIYPSIHPSIILSSTVSVSASLSARLVIFEPNLICFLCPFSNQPE